MDSPLELTPRFWLTITIGLGWLLLVSIILFYPLRTSIPPLEQLQRSEGVLEIERIGPRAGYRTLLRKSDGTIEKFSCRSRDGGLHDCIDQDKVGQKAVIWWYPLAINSWQTDRHVVQMIAGREIIISLEKTTRNLESVKLWNIGLGLLMFIAVVVVVIFEYQKARRNHASKHC